MALESYTRSYRNRGLTWTFDRGHGASLASRMRLATTRTAYWRRRLDYGLVASFALSLPRLARQSMPRSPRRPRYDPRATTVGPGSSQGDVNGYQPSSAKTGTLSKAPSSSARAATPPVLLHEPTTFLLTPVRLTPVVGVWYHWRSIAASANRPRLYSQRCLADRIFNVRSSGGQRNTPGSGRGWFLNKTAVWTSTTRPSTTCVSRIRFSEPGSSKSPQIGNPSLTATDSAARALTDRRHPPRAPGRPTVLGLDDRGNQTILGWRLYGE